MKVAKYKWRIVTLITVQLLFSLVSLAKGKPWWEFPVTASTVCLLALFFAGLIVKVVNEITEDQ